ncbi:hypothetical protein LINPERPRIM_LOCUS27787 [Linum perenne]
MVVFLRMLNETGDTFRLLAAVVVAAILTR